MRGSRGGGGQGVRTPLKNHKNIGFLRNTGPDPLKFSNFLKWYRGQADICGLFCEFVAPPRKKILVTIRIVPLGTCLGALETDVLLSFLWSAFCKWPVIDVTLLTLKIVVLKIQD